MGYTYSAWTDWLSACMARAGAHSASNSAVCLQTQTCVPKSWIPVRTHFFSRFAVHSSGGFYLMPASKPHVAVLLYCLIWPQFAYYLVAVGSLISYISPPSLDRGPKG